MDKESMKFRLAQIFEGMIKDTVIIFEDVEKSDAINEVAMKRVVRNGKIVRKVKVKRKGFKVLRDGNKVKFVRLTMKEKRVRRKSARMAWRVGKASRKNQTRRTMIRSKVRMKQLYGK